MSSLHRFIFPFGILMSLTFYLMFPGNVDWICDQPLLIAKALNANRLNQWGELGLAGGNGTVYGPVPNFIYQLLLQITHDLPNIVMFKSFLAWLMIVFSLVRIAKDLSYRNEVIVLVLFSPFLYLYNRSLWDNVFLIPFSALFCSSVIRYCKSKQFREFILASLIAAILIHIHLMATIMIIPGMLVLNWVSAKCSKKQMGLSLAIQLLLGLLSLPYFTTLLNTKTLNPYGRPQWGAILLSPILGFRLFGYFGFFEYFSPHFYSFFGWPLKLMVFALFGCTAIGPIYFFIGMKKLVFSPSGFIAPVRAFFLGVIAMTLVVSFKMNLRAHPHYMNASWSVYFCILWSVISEYWDNIKSRRLLTAYGISMIVMLVVWVTYIQLNVGDRGLHFGPTLGNQIQVAKQLPRVDSLSNLKIEIENFTDFPQRLTVLAGIYGHERGKSLKRKLVYLNSSPKAEIGIIPEQDGR